MMHPMGQDGVDIDAIVGQQPVHLFDSVFGDQATREGQPLTDCMNRQRCGPDDAERGIGQKPRVRSGFIVYPAYQVTYGLNLRGTDSGNPPRTNERSGIENRHS